MLDIYISKPQSFHPSHVSVEYKSSKGYWCQSKVPVIIVNESLVEVHKLEEVKGSKVVKGLCNKLIYYDCKV